MEKNKGILLVIYVIIAAAIIGFAAWWGSSLTQTPTASQTADISQQQAQGSQTQTSTATNSTSTMDSSLKIVDTTVGTGAVAQDGDLVTVNYTGTLDNGTVFDSSLKAGRTPFSFVLGAGQVIQGWDQGVLGMKVGGTRELTIPPALGYGAAGTPGGPIPPNATLHFTVTLLSVSSTASGQ